MALCTDAKCSGLNMLSGWQIENVHYSREDAIKLISHTMSKTRILSGIMETGVGLEAGRDFAQAIEAIDMDKGNVDGPYVTLIEDVVIKKRMVGDRLHVNFRSKVNGADPRSCGFKPGIQEYQDIQREFFTNTISLDAEYCMHKMIDKFVQSKFAGKTRAKQSSDFFLSDWVFGQYSINIAKMWDIHAWNGDYGCPDESRCHADGFLKIAVDGLNAATAHKVRFTPSDIEAGDSVYVVSFSGHVLEVPFDTDVATTLTAIETALNLNTNGFLDKDGNTIFTAITDTATYIEVTGRRGRPLFLTMLIADSGLTAAELVTHCTDTNGDWKVTLIGDNANGNTMVAATQVPYVRADSPITINLEAITQNNILTKLEELSEAITNSPNPEILQPDFGGILFVGTHIWQTLRFKLTKETAAFKGSCSDFSPCMGLYGFNRIVLMPEMPKDFMFFGRPENLYVGTNVLAEFKEINQIYDPKCETIVLKGAQDMGFGIGNLNEIAGTFEEAAPTGRLSFQPMFTGK